MTVVKITNIKHHTRVAATPAIDHPTEIDVDLPFVLNQLDYAFRREQMVSPEICRSPLTYVSGIVAVGDVVFEIKVRANEGDDVPTAAKLDTRTIEEIQRDAFYAGANWGLNRWSMDAADLGYKEFQRKQK